MGILEHLRHVLSSPALSSWSSLHLTFHGIQDPRSHSAKKRAMQSNSLVTLFVRHIPDRSCIYSWDARQVLLKDPLSSISVEGAHIVVQHAEVW